MSAPQQQPSSWRDVYTLVRDTRDDVLREMAEVKDEVAGLRAKVDTHLLEHAATGGRAAQRLALVSSIRLFIATILPIPATILAVLALVKS
jgi:hypothetical protein